MKDFDYIFTGAGLSSLMVAYRMAVSGNFKDRTILLIDADTKKENDRTWCFWEKGSGNWDAIVHKQWHTALFACDSFSTSLDFEGYAYKMIQGLDFYNYIFTELKKHTTITIVQQRVMGFSASGTRVTVKTDTDEFTCGKIINSIYHPEMPLAQKKYPVLQQHFIGWKVKTKEPVFTPEKATFMDFSVPQKGNTRFMYVLPTTPHEALVEYTLFSEKLLPKEEYENAIKDYLSDLGVTGYEITDTEKGSIPMTVYPFWENNSENVLHIGSAGGWTKASTGYTFKNADKKSAALVAFLEKQSDLSKFQKKKRFWFYDLLLLDILYQTNEKGSAIFSAMFKSGKAGLIFKFLDEETTPAEELQVILKCPKTPFIKALFKRLVNL